VPLVAVANGGIYHWTGDRDVPDIHNTLYDYGKFQVVVLANLVSNFDGGEIVRFMGDKGTVVLTEEDATLIPYDECWEYQYPLESWPRDTKSAFLAAHKDDRTADIGTCHNQPKRKKQHLQQTAEGTKDHMQNFFSCVRSRQQPIENVDFGCGTAVACQPTDPACKWTAQNWGAGWIYGPDYLPTGDVLFAPGAVANFGSYSDPKATALIQQTITGPAPYCPAGISPSKSMYCSGWSSVWTASRFSCGSGGMPLGIAQEASTRSCSRRRSQCRRVA